MATKRKISNEKFWKNLTEGEYKEIIAFASQRENTKIAFLIYGREK